MGCATKVALFTALASFGVYYLCGTLWAVLIPIAFIAYRKSQCSKGGCGCCNKKVEIGEKEWKKDTVYLYQFPRLAEVPNVSPFAMKLETFLKANKIPHELRYSFKTRSKHGLVPYIELNGEQVADSQLIMFHLIKHFNIEVGSVHDEAVGRAVDRMLENHTAYVYSKYKFQNTPSFFPRLLKDARIPDFIRPFLLPFAEWMLIRKANKKIRMVLGGEFSEADHHILLTKDLDVVKEILGEKKFLFGDKISSVDCTVFGHLGSIYYIDGKNEVKRLLNAEYPTIAAYLDRVKDLAYGENFTQKH